MIRERKKKTAFTAAVFLPLLLTAICTGCDGAGTGSADDGQTDAENWEDATSQSSYRLLEGTPYEVTVQVLKGEREGESIYLTAGIHGDETAGWKAANEWKNSSMDAGTLYILSPANVYGAEMNQRKTREERDLNRNFPGDPNGCDAEQIAAAIYDDIRDKQPQLVLDLHEAVPAEGERDSLGNSLICQSIDSVGELVLELLVQSEQEGFVLNPLTLYGSPPPGSINRVVTEELGIPVLTVETFREEELETRIANHLAIIEYVLQYYGLQEQPNRSVTDGSFGE